MKLNIGSDIFKIQGFVNVDIRLEIHPDLVMDIRNLGIRPKSVSEINIGNVLEHLPENDAYKALNECRQILKNEGVLYITIPLVDRAEKCLKTGIIDQEKYNFIINGEPEGPNSHKTGFKSGDMEKILIDCGFRYQLIDLKTFPYILVSDVKNPVIDPWQYGIRAFTVEK